MTQRSIRNRRPALVAAAALMLMLAGCAAPNSAASTGSSWPAGAGSYDPYHYRCAGNCQAGA